MRAWLLLACLACSKTEAPQTPDAGPDTLDLSQLGAQVTLPMTWSAIKTEAELGRAQRRPDARPFDVPPRLVASVEPITLEDPEQVFGRVRDDILLALTQGGAQVTRTTLARRPLGDTLVGELELAYQVPPANWLVIQRTLIAPRRLPDERRTVLTLTATYLEADATQVGPEVHQILGTVRLFAPLVPDGGIP